MHLHTIQHTQTLMSVCVPVRESSLNVTTHSDAVMLGVSTIHKDLSLQICGQMWVALHHRLCLPC